MVTPRIIWAPVVTKLAIANESAEVVSGIPTHRRRFDEGQGVLTQYPQRLLQLYGGAFPHAGALAVSVFL